MLKKNLPKSALAEVKKIYAKAKSEGQEAQRLKALVYMVGLQQETREDHQVKSIRELETDLATTKEPARSILISIIARHYLDYFRQQRYRIYNRTTTVNFKKEDLATWGWEDFIQKINGLYLESLKPKALLQQTRLDAYGAVIMKGKLSALRPTLYDLLAHEALEYFMDDSREVTRPAATFELDQTEAFAPGAQFASFPFTSSDTASLHHKAIAVFQELIRLHINDADPAALVDVDLKRLAFVHQYHVSAEKDSLYRHALQNIANRHGYRTAAGAWYQLAVLYEQEALTYDPNEDTTHRYARMRARDILQKIVADSSKKDLAWQQSKALLHNIQKRFVTFMVESVNLPGEPFRVLINHKDISRIYLRLIPMTEDLKSDYYEEKYWQKLAQAKAIRSWQQDLPQSNDMQPHSVEIKVDALPKGAYVLFVSESPDPDFKKTSMAARSFFVSNISLVTKEKEGFVLHRKTGQPLAGASVQQIAHTYDRATEKMVFLKGAIIKTDGNGYFKIKPGKDQANMYLDVSYGDETYRPEQVFYIYNDPVNTKDTRSTEKFIEQTHQTHLFTDRSIYRPGQVVHFKGISSAWTTSKPHFPLVNYKSTVYLRNANAQVIDSLQVVTNEYGSFSGKFTLPQGGLNGSFGINMKAYRGHAGFQVEDYKRPKFYLEQDEIKQAYKVYDTISITGSAKAYAGNNIEDATVVYRVTRRTRYPYFWLAKIMDMGRMQEIAHGTIKTDDQGKFTFRFPALPDKRIDTASAPIFDYFITVNVTDINGETRSMQKMVSAGYHSMILKMTLEEVVSIDSGLRSMTIKTENMNGAFQPAQVTVEVSQLDPPHRMIRRRLWHRPDQFIMDKETFIRYFPNDEYNKENDKEHWRKSTMFTVTDTASRTGRFDALRNRKLAAGHYEVVVSVKDKDGKIIRDKRYVEIYDPRSLKMDRPAYLWTKAGNKPIEPGQKDSVVLGTSAADVFLITQKDRYDLPGQGRFTFSKLNNGKSVFEFGADPSEKGGYGLIFFFVKNNRYYMFQDNIEIPWSEKELDIEYVSYRDKTLPGSEERWKVRITGTKAEKVNAEVMAGMYDASLDQFMEHKWAVPAIWNHYSGHLYWYAIEFEARPSRDFYLPEMYVEQDLDYDRLINFDNIAYYDEDRKRYIDLSKEDYGYRRRPSYEEATVRLRGQASMGAPKQMTVPTAASPPGATGTATERMAADAGSMDFNTKLQGRVQGLVQMDGVIPDTTTGNNAIQDIPVVRKNLQETAFFFPHLQTDSTGAIEFSFTTPEALTTWKLMTLAHTKDLAFGTNTRNLVTQKELMVQPNAPRFLRQGDRMEFSVKVVNLSAKEMTGQVELQLVDAATNQSIDGWFLNSFPNQYFTVAAGGSELVKFPMEVPHLFTSAVIWKVIARSGNYSDGEEMVLPVLSNRTLVTETIALPMKGSGTKNFTFKKLTEATSETLEHRSLTVEFTSNPAWYVVQALPYLSQYPYDCSEQVWNRYYANLLAGHIINAAPGIKKVFEQWRTMDTSALLSNLQKNEELKYVLLEETPWVMEAKSEAEQKKNLALLFDLVRLSEEQSRNVQKLAGMQLDNGAFPWFKGGREDRYITQYILTGVGRLRKIEVYGKNDYGFVGAAIQYADIKILQDYQQLIRSKAKLEQQQPGYMQVQYLYLRSFFKDIPVAKASKEAYDYYFKQAGKYWLKAGKQLQGMIALSYHRAGDRTIAAAILRSLKETSNSSEELGMYWKENERGRSWYWYHAPIETQALMIEVFSEAGKDLTAVDDMRTWLIRNKQTNNWHTTKATADACYAFLLKGTDWLSSDPAVKIKMGNLNTSNTDQRTEAGTGYFKKTIEPTFIKPEMGNISVDVQPRNSQGNPSAQAITTTWGAVYWQYFEDLDKITPAATPLQLTKKLFIEKNTDKGPVLTPVEEGATLKVGDKVKVRIVLRSDRDMDYVHMKDMRAAAMEPTNVLSGYRYQDGLGYYETTRDASTNFFFDHLSKGTYVFEYTLFVTHTGNYSNGITSIQCMYAPEFNAHSEGIRILIE